MEIEMKQKQEQPKTATETEAKRSRVERCTRIKKKKRLWDGEKEKKSRT